MTQFVRMQTALQGSLQYRARVPLFYIMLISDFPAFPHGSDLCTFLLPDQPQPAPTSPILLQTAPACPDFTASGAWPWSAKSQKQHIVSINRHLFPIQTSIYFLYKQAFISYKQAFIFYKQSLIFYEQALISYNQAGLFLQQFSIPAMKINEKITTYS